ncbi:MAG TPA: amino acid adenylation domain-containing protein, partial [Mycobacteriales bacterium]|nr:amino acid adenylation domain-containing protein [Mycobacteriales bacterium]
HEAASQVELVGYVVPAAGRPVEPAELRAALARSLPEYLVPTVYLEIERLPLTANGKLDRRALPLPDQASRADRAGPVAPRTAEEARVAEIWQHALGLPEVSVTASFFDLGGDSIRAVALVGQLRAAGFEVAVRDVFAHRTIAALCAALTGQPVPDEATVRPFALLSTVDQERLPAGVVDAYPLSQVQVGMLVEMLAGAGDRPRSYHNVSAVPIRDEPFSLPALRAAAALLAGRHEILRTSVRLDGFSVPLQLVHATAEIPVELADLRTLPDSRHEQAVRELIAGEEARLFDLDQPPLLRLTVQLLSDDDWVLTFTQAHAILDGWSSNALMLELLDCYRSIRDGQPPVREAVPAVRYADFIAAETAALQSTADTAYWQELLGRHGRFALPAGWGDRPGQPAETFAVPVPYADLADGLRELARTSGTSVKSVLLAAHLKVLSQLTDEPSFLTGLVTHGRPELAGAERVPGMYLNTVPFAADRTARTWRELARQVFDREVGMWPHRRFPLPAIQRLAGDGQRLDVYFTYLDFGSLDGDGDAAAADRSLGSARTEFGLAVTSLPGRLVLRADSGQLSRANAERMAGMYRAVLAAMASDVDGDATGTFLPAGERERLLGDRDGTAAQPVTRCLHEVFEAQAAATPDAVATIAGATTLTYRELNARANQVAHHLRNLGVQPEDLVGVCLERTADLVPTLLGVLKSGAAYLPLDPGQPAERLGFMLADAAAAVVLTTSSQVDKLAPVHAGPMLAVDTDRALLAAQDGGNLPNVSSPANLAYVIYTSGSTGRPKGVGVTHANVLRLLTTAQEHYAFDETDVWPLFHSYAFDVSVWELFGALLNGGRLVVVPGPVTRSPEDFLDLLVEHEVTVLNQTPSAFRGLIAAAGGNDPRIGRLALRVVVFAGERLELADLAPWVARLGLARVALVNMYGITETTVHTTYQRLQKRNFEPGAGNPIGRPLNDLRVHLLDQRGHLVPVGVVGEIHVGGPGVARGYLGRPELTAQRFVPDPYGTAGSRLYRSGDLARRLPDGSLEFLGRADDQVKIRGYRVELGEITATLAGHPAIRSAVVIADEPAAGDKRLVAYCVPAGPDPLADPDSLAGSGSPAGSGSLAGAGSPAGPGSLAGPDSPAAVELPAPAELAAYCAERLPEYMVPAAFVPLDRLPLTANGKLDRRALPAPDRAALPAGRRYLPPRTPIEDRIAAIWQDVLGLDRVGVEDGFFDLGGDSIRAVTLAGALRAAGIEVSVYDILTHRTVAGLARLAAEHAGTAEPERTVAPFELLSTVDRERLPAGLADAYPLSQVQTGMLVEMMAGGGQPKYHIVTSLRLSDQQPFELPALRAALNLVTERHEVLRTSVDLSGYSVPMQLVHATAEIPIDAVDLRAMAPAEQDRAITGYVEQQQGSLFDLATAPLLRLAVHRCGDTSWQFTTTQCHVILEGWSYHSLLLELLDCYRSIRDSRQPARPLAPVTRYADFVAAELAALASTSDREYWRGVVEDAPTLTLPAGWAGDLSQPREGYRLGVDYADLTDQLRLLATRAGASIKSVLLAAHLKVLSQL